MKKQNVPTTSKLTVLRQACNYIPNHLVPQLARETGNDEKARTFDEWNHIVTLCYAQLTHSIGLNDVFDALQLNSGPLSAIRGATPTTRNNLSHANKVRDPVLAEKLFWAVYENLGRLSPRFLSGKTGKRFARKFKRTIHLVDSTTIQLIAACMDCFSRLFALVRTCLWRKWDLLKLLARYGTAGGHFRYLGRPEQAFFPGFI